MIRQNCLKGVGSVYRWLPEPVGANGWER